MTSIDPAELEVCLRVLAQVEDLPAEHDDAVRVRRATAKIFKAAKKFRKSERKAAITANDRAVTALTATGSPDRIDDETQGLPLVSNATGATAGTLLRARSCYTCRKRFVEVDAFYHNLCPSCAAFNHGKRDARTDLTGRGVVSILAADRLVLQPRLYSTFLLWLLSELFEQLPEVGDLDKPKLAFVFDEAHLLFDNASPALMQRIEQVVRLIRSKGVGVYFCSQFPDDVPGEILGQLGNRIQHALRAFTPRDQKAVKTAAETFVANPKLDVAKAISQLRVGEALVSTLQDNGVPMPVERALMAPPRCRMGTITAEERAATLARSPVGAKYDRPVNRESAYEILTRRRTETAAPDRAAPDRTPAAKPEGDMLHDWLWGTGRRQGMVESMAKQAARTVGSQLGRQILRGVLGGITGGRGR